jgi:hypothetical protein
MKMTLSAAAENRMLDALAGALKGGSMRFYDQTAPASPADAVTMQQHLASLEFSDARRHAGQVTAELRDGLAAGNGRASWARVFDAAGEVVLDCDVGEAKDGAAVTMNTVEFRQGGPIVIRNFAVGVRR